MNTRTLFAHVLKALAAAQSEGRASNLETLTEELRVRRTDIRRTVSALHREGYVDALRMRLTLAGFAIARSLMTEDLPALRKAPASAAIAAA
jgi:Mn-dependent DtxR family transcriptional regulator